MGIYGVTFGDKHTYRDWGLLPTLRPEVSPPEPKITRVTIPGADGALDLTQALTDDVKYKNRKIDFEFLVIGGREHWSMLYSDILDYLHGQNMQIILDEDPEYYYNGRVEVDSWKSNQDTSRIALVAEVEPYKLSRISTTEPWLWDIFNFETGVITDYNEMPFDSVTHRFQRFPMIVTGRKWVVPTITVTSSSGEDVVLSVRGRNGVKSITCQSGVPKKDYSIIFDSAHTCYVSITTQTTGTLTVDYRTGRL